MLFTDASKYVWSAVLTQEHTISNDSKLVGHQHPITYVSGLFQDSHVNWVALMKEVYVM